MSLTPPPTPWLPGCEQVQVLFLAGLRLSCLNIGPEVFGSAINPELGSSKPLGLVDGLKEPLLLLWIPGSCNCKAPEETYNLLSKQAKNLQQPTGRAIVQTWTAARVSQGIHPHPATVMEAARTSSRRMPDHQGESGHPTGTTEGQSYTNDTLTSFNNTIIWTHSGCGCSSSSGSKVQGVQCGPAFAMNSWERAHEL